jgi:uncharacterized protein
MSLVELSNRFYDRLRSGAAYRAAEHSSSGPEVAKLRRIRNDPRVLVAPCTVRGKPLGASVEGTARELPDAEKEHAEAAIQSNYGVGRRLYERTADAFVDDVPYVEVVSSRG